MKGSLETMNKEFYDRYKIEKYLPHITYEAMSNRAIVQLVFAAIQVEAYYLGKSMMPICEQHTNALKHLIYRNFWQE